MPTENELASLNVPELDTLATDQDLEDDYPSSANKPAKVSFLSDNLDEGFDLAAWVSEDDEPEGATTEEDEDMVIVRFRATDEDLVQILQDDLGMEGAQMDRTYRTELPRSKYEELKERFSNRVDEIIP